jgi:hypothetical protein
LNASIASSSSDGPRQPAHLRQRRPRQPPQIEANRKLGSLHAGVDIAPHQREKRERLCRCVSRPPVASERLALTSSGHVRYALKTPCRDGTTHIVLEPPDLMARLAALVPPPRMPMTRFHGVFARTAGGARR